MKRRTSLRKATASVKSRVINSGATSKRITVKVDYDPREDFAIKDFIKRVKAIS